VWKIVYEWLKTGKAIINLTKDYNLAISVSISVARYIEAVLYCCFYLVFLYYHQMCTRGVVKQDEGAHIIADE
jgi:Ca2+/Na+ antiporter